MKAIVVKEPGVIAYETVRMPTRNAGELKVRVHAAALNRLDLWMKENHTNDFILGIEIAGEVIEADAHSRFKVGDRVMGIIQGGGYATHAIIPESSAMRIWDHLTYVEGAAISEVFLTAFQNLFWLGELQDKEHVLIHAGASGVGTAAIQLAKVLKDAHVVITTSTQEKIDTCIGLGADLGINYKEEDFSELLKESVDVVIDPIGAPYFKKHLEVLKVDGRWMMIAAMGGYDVDSFNLSKIHQKRIQIKGTALLSRSESYKERLCQAFYQETSPYFERGLLKPVVDSVYHITEVEKAHQRMMDNLNVGKIILKIGDLDD